MLQTGRFCSIVCIDLAAIEQALRVERLLHGAHERELLGELPREDGDGAVGERLVEGRVVAAYATLLEFVYGTFLRGREPMFTRYSVALLAHSLTLDISAARRDLGYVPRVAPCEGLARFAAWWREKR